jgi:hypothetical protein
LAINAQISLGLGERAVQLELSAFALLLLAIAAPDTRAAERHEIFSVECAQGRSFELQIQGEEARVQLPDRLLRLTRRPSALGLQFGDAKAALVIDGDFVAFAQRGDWEWRDCHLKGRGNSAGLQ